MTRLARSIVVFLGLATSSPVASDPAHFELGAGDGADSAKLKR